MIDIYIFITAKHPNLLKLIYKIIQKTEKRENKWKIQIILKNVLEITHCIATDGILWGKATPSMCKPCYLMPSESHHGFEDVFDLLKINKLFYVLPFFNPWNK